MTHQTDSCMVHALGKLITKYVGNFFVSQLQTCRYFFGTEFAAKVPAQSEHRNKAGAAAQSKPQSHAQNM